MREINGNSSNSGGGDKCAGGVGINNSGGLMINLLGDNDMITSNSNGNDYDILDSSIKNLVDKLDDIQLGRNSTMFNSIKTNTINGNNSNSMMNSIAKNDNNIYSVSVNNNNAIVDNSSNNGVNNINSSCNKNTVSIMKKSSSIMMTVQQQAKTIQNVVGVVQQ